MLARLDVRVASVHSKLRMDAAPMTKRMLGAIRNPRTNVLGHCTGRMVMGNRGTRPSSFDAKAVFEACVEHDVAVEINSRPERRDPPSRLSSWPVPWVACSPSTATRMRRVSSTSSSTAASERTRRHRPRPHRQHLAPRTTLGLGQPGPLRTADVGWVVGATVSSMPPDSEWRYAVPSGVAARSRRTARATASSC